MTDIATLALRVDALEVKVAGTELDKLARTAKKASAEAQSLTFTFANLKTAVKAVSVAFSLYKLVDYAKDAALLNARYETLGISMYQAGRNAGYMRSEMDAYQKALEKTGISMVESRNTLIQMSAASMDLANVTKLARAAQDLAVVGNTNSSEAFNRLVYGIKSGQMEILRTLGINVQFDEGYKKLAASIGKTSASLSENEKLQARTNVTMEAAVRYSGIYEEAMGTAGKQLGSLARYQENFKLIVGETFNEGLAFGVAAFTEELKGATEEAKLLQAQGNLREWGRMMVATFAAVVDAGRLVANTLMVAQLTVRQFAIAGKSLLPGSGLSIAQSNVLIDQLQADKTEHLIGMMEGRLKTYESVMTGFERIDRAKIAKAEKAAQEYVEVPKKAAAAYLAATKDGVKAQEAAYMAVMEASGLEWKGRGQIRTESSVDMDGGARAKSIKSMIDKLNREAETFGKTAAEIAVYDAAKAGAGKNVQDRIRVLAEQIEAQKKEAESAKESKRLMDERAESIKSVIVQLNRESETFGKTAAQIAVYDAVKAGAGVGEQERIRVLAEQIEAQKEMAQTAKELEQRTRAQALEAQAIYADLDPIYKAGLAWEKYVELVKTGVLDLQTAGQHYAKSFGKSTDQMAEYAKQAGRNIQDAFAQFLFDPFKDGLGGMLDGFQIMLRRMAAEAIAANVLNAVGNWGKTGGGAGSFFGNIASSIFGGAKAIGGPVSGGTTYLVGERGPELFTPSSSGNITPSDKLRKSLTVVNNFTISRPIDRRTQEQIAAMAGTSIQIAMIRGA